MADTFKLVSEKTGLFNSFTVDEFQSLISEANTVSFSENQLIVQEHDLGDALYIIINGTVDVFTSTPTGEELLLATLQKGDYFGEQALLFDSLQKRNASVRANTNTILLKVTYQDFRKVLSKDPNLKNKLVEIGNHQIRAKALRQSSLFRAIRPEELSGDWYIEKTFSDNQVIFNEGDPADSLYLITSGIAEVYRKEGENQKLLAKLREGQCFGELALLQQKPRAATVIAQEGLKTLCIQGNKFIQLYEKHPEIREYLQTLQTVYSLSGKGFVTQHIGEFMGMQSITTIYHLLDGTNAIASHVIGKSIVNMTLSGADITKAENLVFEENNQWIKRELLISNNRIISVTSEGFWSELGKIYQMILEQTPLDDIEIETFRKIGLISPEKQSISDDPNQIICQCLQIKLSTFQNIIQLQKCSTTTQLTKLTGASTVCGSCQFLVQEIVEGKPNWIPVRLSQRIPVSKDIATFRFIPLTGKLQLGKPGQHIVIQAKIDGKWVQRSYTFTSSYSETSYCEITVKRIDGGYFSNWLFDHLNHEAEIRISPPTGEYFVDLSKKTPIVCLVAGIGMTPALAIYRALLKGDSSRALYIDYTTSFADQLVYRQELEHTHNPNIKTQFRISREQGRITEHDVQDIVRKYPDADFYICGPIGFEEAVTDYLINWGVAETQIFVEKFFSPPREPEVEEKVIDRSYFYIGISLLALFFIQYILHLKLGFLEKWQNQEIYKMLSGTVVALFIAIQWYFPVLRIRRKSVEAAKQYTIHKQIGAFAPLIYYFHSTKVGFGFLFMLSTAYFTNNLLGLFNHDLVKNSMQRRRYSEVWLAPHIILSLLTVALMIYHIFIAIYYE